MGFERVTQSTWGIYPALWGYIVAMLILLCPVGTQPMTHCAGLHNATLLLCQCS